MAALLQENQILAYEEYASALIFSRALPSRFLNGLVKGACAAAA
jgi:hypothetical protein